MNTENNAKSAVKQIKIAAINFANFLWTFVKAFSEKAWSSARDFP